MRDNLTPDLQNDFDAFVGFIARTGFVSRFRGTRYVYVEIGEFRYWQSRSLFQTGSNLNRVRLEDVVEDDQLSLGGL